MQKTRRRGGFTLIELIVVVAILGILAALVIPQVTGYVAQSQKNTCQSNIRAFAQLYDLQLADNLDSYDTDDKLTALLKDVTGNKDGAYASKELKCPGRGIYISRAWKDALGNIQWMISCTKHGGINGNATVAIAMDTVMGERLDEIKELLDKKANGKLTTEELARLKELVNNPHGGISNDNLRDALIGGSYNGEWPQLESEILEKSVAFKNDKLYVQPYVVEKPPSFGVILFANGNDKNQRDWNTRAVYDSASNTWYEYVVKNQWGKDETFKMTSLGSSGNMTIDELREQFKDEAVWRPME